MSTEKKSRAELLKELENAKNTQAELEKQIKESYDEAVKIVCVNFATLLESNKLELKDALSYLQTLGKKTEKKTTAKGQLGDDQKKELGNDTYYNPDLDKEWKLGKKGPVPKWIFDSLAKPGDVSKYKGKKPTVNE